jgi:hypothetical protein
MDLCAGIPTVCLLKTFLLVLILHDSTAAVSDVSTHDKRAVRFRKVTQADK